MSMTGYGHSSFHYDDVSLMVEIRSVNSRYLDVIPKIPHFLNYLELDLKKLIQEHFSRGRIECYISFTGNSYNRQTLHVNWELLDQFMEEIKHIQTRYHLQDGPSLASILTLEDLYSIEEEKEPDEELKKFILSSVRKVIDLVKETRRTEGLFLMEDIMQRTDQISDAVQTIEQNKQLVYNEYRKRIEERIKKHLDHFIEYERGELMQDIALLAEKSDISEEVIRLKSHLQHFKQVAQSTSEKGRKLDFIVQEMHREANTIGSKSVDVKINETIVFIKSSLEKIKEQIQNIE